jgi:hypothetical protein
MVRGLLSGAICEVEHKLMNFSPFLVAFAAAALFQAGFVPRLSAAPPPFNSPAIPHVTSWIGNTYPGAKKWVQQDVRTMAVTPEGTVFTNVEWEEGGGNVGEYRDGELIRYAKHTHGWGVNGGLGVAFNSKYLFASLVVGNEGGGLKDTNTWPARGLKWFGVTRRPRADISKPAPFPGGKGGKGDTLKECFLIVAEVPEKGGAPLAGLAATEKELFVSDPNAGEIQVFDGETMQLLRRWKVGRAGPLAVATNGRVWMLQRATPQERPQIVSFSPDGMLLPQKVTFDPTTGIGGSNSMPVAFCLTGNASMLICDNGPAQRLVAASHIDTQPRLDVGLGTPGGIHSGAGRFEEWRLNRPSAVGVDAKGNIYVAQNGQTGGGGTVLESFSALGKLNWRLFGLTFVDMADVDPADDAHIFTKEEHFKFDYTQPPGREWSYAGYTVDPFKYPQDPRLHIWSAGAWVRRIGQGDYRGRPARILFVSDMNGDELQVYRFRNGYNDETAIPSGFFAKRRVSDKKDPGWLNAQPAKGEWIWRDTNGNGAFDGGEFVQPRSSRGNEAPSGRTDQSLLTSAATNQTDAPASQGWWVDARGGVWLATETKGIRHFPMLGVDAVGNPVWSYTNMQTFAAPPEFKQLKRVRYVPETDTLFLAGTTAEHKNQHWKPSGPVLARYDGWLKGDHKLRWKIVAPYAAGSQGHSSCEPMGFDVAGDFVFVPYTGASKPDQVKHGRVEIFRATDGTSAGHLEPGEDVGEIGLQDIRECLSAHRRADGEYLVLLEDDYKSKIVAYRIRPGALK